MKNMMIKKWLKMDTSIYIYFFNFIMSLIVIKCQFHCALFLGMRCRINPSVKLNRFAVMCGNRNV